MKKIKRWQWFVLVASFFQLISPPILTLLDLSVSNENSGTEPQLTPAGYTFSIWGVITLLAFGYGVYQALPERQNQQLHKLLSRRLAIVYVLFICWLVAAVLQWLIITVLIFVVMFHLLTLVFREILEQRHHLNMAEKITLFGQIAVYTGWTTVAIFANTASALTFYGLSNEGTTGIVWQAVILALALLNGKYWLNKFNRDLVFGGTIIWALTGVFFGLLQYNNNTLLRVITIFGIMLVAVHLITKKVNPSNKISQS